MGPKQRKTAKLSSVDEAPAAPATESKTGGVKQVSKNSTRREGAMSNLGYLLFILAFISVAIAARGLLAAQPHSGYGKPPMHGDFEAQRHWVELTNGLPLGEWYKQGPDNNLQYWGIDYPPITTYHSWAIGKVARVVLKIIAPGDQEQQDALWDSMFGLKVSHGSEGPLTIVAMQTSVMVSEALVYVPAVFYFLIQLHGGISDFVVARRSFLMCLFFLMFPLPVMFVDYGHFQFNFLSLGLMVFAVGFGLKAMRVEVERGSWSSSLFYTCLSIVSIVSSILFKQMSLYFALPCGGFYLGMALRYARFSNKRSSIVAKVFKFLFAFVLFVFAGIGFAALIFAPFALADSFPNVIDRMFPFGRGLYEDKVANLWCSVSPFFKMHNFVVNNLVIFAPKLTPDAFLSLEHETQQQIVRTVMALICAFTTLLGSLPAIIGIAIYLCMSKSTVPIDASDDSEEDDVDDSLIQPRREERFFMRGAEVFVGCVFVGSMSFFLFSYQVHEKSILLPTMSAILLLCTRISRHAAYQECAAVAINPPSVKPKEYSALQDPIVAAFIHLTTIAMYSLFPLAIKDKLIDSYIVMIVFSSGMSQGFATAVAPVGILGRVVSISMVLSCIGILFSHIFYAKYEPPQHLPDINTMVLTMYAGAHFLVYFFTTSIMVITEIPFNILVEKNDQLRKTGDGKAKTE